MIRPQCLPQSAPRLCRRQAIGRYAPRARRCTTSRQFQQYHIRTLRIGIKSNILSTTHAPNDDHTVASSRILDGFISPFDSTVVRKLKEHGVHNLQTHQSMDEFGMGSHSQTASSGPVPSLFSRNGLPLSPGGSSGGSAVSVAKGECDVAIGTDTGGSVRLPASFCGIVGLKPSYGRISRWGVVQYANSLDTVGVLGRRVRDVRGLMDVLEGEDWRDGTSLGGKVTRRFEKRKDADEGALKIGVPVEYNIEELDGVVTSAWLDTLEMLRSVGHTIHQVSLPSTRSALSAYYILAPAEASSNLAKYDGIRYGRRTKTAADADPPRPLYAQTRDEGFGDEVKRRILLGAYTLSSAAMDNYFIQAQKIRRQVQQDFDRVFSRANPLQDHRNRGSNDEEEKVDILLTPTAPILPPTIEDLKKQTSLESYMNDVFTVPASLAGLPAVSIPAPLREAREEGDVKSTGMQIVGQFGDDETVLRIAEMLEGMTGERKAGVGG